MVPFGHPRVFNGRPTQMFHALQNGSASIGYKLNSSSEVRVGNGFKKDGLLRNTEGNWATLSKPPVWHKKKISHYRQLFTVSFAAVIFLSNQVNFSPSIETKRVWSVWFTHRNTQNGLWSCLFPALNFYVMEANTMFKTRNNWSRKNSSDHR